MPTKKARDKIKKILDGVSLTTLPLYQKNPAKTRFFYLNKVLLRFGLSEALTNFDKLGSGGFAADDIHKTFWHIKIICQ